MVQTRWLFVWMMCSGLLLSTTSQAQQPTATGQVDLQRLIAAMGQGGGQVNLQDAVWDLQSGNGAQLMALPMIFSPAESAYSVSRPGVSPHSSRFVGYYIPKPDGHFGQGRGANQPALDLRTLASGDLDAIEQLLLAEPVDPQQQRELERQRQEAERRQAELDALNGEAEPEGDVVPEFAPRLTRALQITPDGMVVWQADRSIPGARLKPGGEQNLYGYKLDSQALREKEPPRPERIERQQGEDSRAFSDRRREQQQRYRDEVGVYRELRERVGDLPDRFSEPLPKVIYAVFTVAQTDSVELQGPDPYPWTLTRTDAQNLQKLAQGRTSGRGNGPGLETNAAISVLTNFLASGHPLSQQAVAVAAYEAGLAGQVLEGDAGYRLLGRLLSSDDALTQQIILTSLAQTRPQTRASAKLLAEAARSAPEGLAEALQLASLRAMFSIDVAQAENTNFLVNQINQAIQDPDGPPAGKVIDELLRALERTGSVNNRGGSGEANRIDVALVKDVAFTGVADEDLDGLIASIIRSAPSNTTASGWLDLKLLRSGDDRLVSRTLELLGQADTGSTLIKPLTADLRGLVFGEPADHAEGEPLDLTLKGKLPLDSADHGIVVAITASDPTRRALAWQVLRHFEITGHTGRTQDGVDNQAVIFDHIVDSGLSIEGQTPVYLIDFIDNQSEGQLGQRASERMNELLLRNIADSVKMRAARKYIASPQRYGQLLSQAQPLERGVIIEELYRLLTGSSPAILGLARDPQGRQSGWFVDHMQKTGALPTPQEWAASQTEQALLQTATVQDNTVRTAAASALVLNAGGDEDDRTQLLNAILPLATPDANAVADAWRPIKQGIYAKVLAEAAGSYSLMLTVRGQNQGGGLNLGQQPGQRAPQANPADPPAQTTPAQPGDLSLPVLRQIDLGVVDLKVEQLQLSLSVETVPVMVGDERLSIRLNDVSTFAGFNHPDLADLPLSQLYQWVDLMPQGDGSWTGSMQLPNGLTLQISLRPA